MRRYALLLAVCATATISTGCGDPIVVLGESPGTVRVVAGIGDSAGVRLDTLATKTRLTGPTAVAFNDATLRLYLADRGASTSSGSISSPVARIFSVTSSNRIKLELDAGGCVTGGICIGEATDMAIGAGSDLLIADAIRHRVTSFNVDTHVQTNIAGTGALANATEGAAAATTPISAPSGVARGTDGTVYVSEGNSGRVLSIGANGLYHVVAGGGTQAVTTTPITATTARLVFPAGLAISNGILYIADRDRSVVNALNLSSGQIATVAGNGLAGFSGDDGLAPSAQLSGPKDVVVDAAGTTLYISDSSNQRVRAVNLTTNIIRTYMGSGSQLYNGARLPAGAVSLKNPFGIAVSALGFLFVADQGHHVIRRAATGF